jgi:SAM-dependent methyltransferase
MNKNDRVIKEFGEEWTKYDFTNRAEEKIFESFQQYFDIFPWALISQESEGFDMGCGSGRWAQFVAPKVKKLFCIEPSKAINVAKSNLKEFPNVRYLEETTETCSLDDASQDFGYCLGVLHHIPNTESALKDCSRLLKQGAPFLLYLYYNFENKPWWFRGIWKVSDLFRKIISSLPKTPKNLICELIAITIYFPLARLSLLLEKLGIDVSNIPLSDYRKKPFYISRNDALDRFGTRLEQRYSKLQVTEMLKNTGFENITISLGTPYWCYLAFKR